MTKKQLLSLAALVGLASASHVSAYIIDGLGGVRVGRFGLGVGSGYYDGEERGLGANLGPVAVGVTPSYYHGKCTNCDEAEAAPKKNKRQDRKDTRAEKRARKAKTDASY